VILFLHHRYRTTGGEERAVAELMGVVRDELGEPVELLERDSGAMPARRAAAGLLAGGLDPQQVGDAVRRTGARVVHAHNLLPTFGPRALEAARAAGARTVLHLHNYRLVCAVATCFTHGEDCTRCHGRNTLPGVRLACRGDRVEGAVYAAGLARAQHGLTAAADVVAVPSGFARERLRALGAPLPWDRVRVVPHVVRVPSEPAWRGGDAAFVASRLAPEKGLEVAIEACAAAGVPLRIAGDGPERRRLEELAEGRDVTFLGRLDVPGVEAELAGAAVALAPSRAAETFGLSAVEAMALGVPVVASRTGALADLLPDAALVPPGDVGALAGAIRARWNDAEAGSAGRNHAAAFAGPPAVAAALRELYG
jgi:glycosyltransferase involved in cell wall biosynthesis